MHAPRLPAFRIASSLRGRIFGGFAVVLLLLAALAAVAVFSTWVVEQDAARVGLDSSAAEAATEAALQVGEAHARVVQYALAATVANQHAAEASLSRLDQVIAGRGAAGGEDGLTPLVTAYRKTVAATFDAIGARRDAIERLQSVGTDLRTTTSAVAGRMEGETEPDLIRAGLGVSQQFSEADASASRFLVSHNPADASTAGLALQTLRGKADRLAGLATQNRRLQRFTAALTEPLQHYTEALQQVSDADDRLRVASSQRQAATDAVLAAAAAERARGMQSQRSAITAMTGTVGSARRLGLLTALAAIGIGLVLAALIGRSIARPVRALTHAMRDLAAGRLETAVPHVGRGGELGEMAEAVLVFKENAAAVRRLEAEQADAKRAAEAERHTAMAGLERSFQASVNELAGALQDRIAELRLSAETMSRESHQASGEGELVAGAAQQASANVDAVAAAAEELAASVREISRQVDDSARVARQAEQQAGDTASTINTLATAGQHIGEVVAIINDIAGRTNLLALNATIEAARAGEAGKGFAVVASEVKALAAQTEKATDDIKRQVESIRTVTGQAVSAVHAIGATITRMSGIANAIAAAVEQQGAATEEIARSVQQAAEGTAQVSRGAGSLTGAARKTDECAAGVLATADELRVRSTSLTHSVDQFLAAIRAA